MWSWIAEVQPLLKPAFAKPKNARKAFAQLLRSGTIGKCKQVLALMINDTVVRANPSRLTPHLSMKATFEKEITANY